MRRKNPRTVVFVNFTCHRFLLTVFEENGEERKRWYSVDDRRELRLMTACERVSRTDRKDRCIVFARILTRVTMTISQVVVVGTPPERKQSFFHSSLRI